MLDKNVITMIKLLCTSSLLILHYNLYDLVYQPLLVRCTYQSMPQQTLPSAPTSVRAINNFSIPSVTAAEGEHFHGACGS